MPFDQYAGRRFTKRAYCYVKNSLRIRYVRVDLMESEMASAPRGSTLANLILNIALLAPSLSANGCEFPINSIQLCMLSLGSGNLNSWGQSLGINQVNGSVLCVSFPAQLCFPLLHIKV